MSETTTASELEDFRHRCADLEWRLADARNECQQYINQLERERRRRVTSRDGTLTFDQLYDDRGLLFDRDAEAIAKNPGMADYVKDSVAKVRALFPSLPQGNAVTPVFSRAPEGDVRLALHVQLARWRIVTLVREDYLDGDEVRTTWHVEAALRGPVCATHEPSVALAHFEAETLQGVTAFVSARGSIGSDPRFALLEVD